MLWCKKRNSWFAAALVLLIAACCNEVALGAIAPIINGCQEAAGANDGTAALLDVVINVSAHPAQNVHFTDCSISNTNIRVVVFSSPTRIELRNFTLQGGSFVISGESADGIRGVTIVADHVVMEGDGDVLVLRHTSPTPSITAVATIISNVSMTIANSILKSTHGNVASAVTPAVDNILLEIQGNTTVNSNEGVAASIVANHVSNATILVTCCSRGSIRVHTGNTALEGNTGAFSIFALETIAATIGTNNADDGAHLFVENVKIIMAVVDSTGAPPPTNVGEEQDGIHHRDNSAISFLVEAKSGAHSSVCIGSICLNHGALSTLELRGTIHLSFQYQQEGGGLERDSIEGDEGSSSSSQAQDHHMSSVACFVQLHSEAASHSAAVAIGGIAVNTNDVRTSSDSLVSCQACTVLINFDMASTPLQKMSSAQQQQQQPLVSIVSKIAGRGGASAVFGLATNGYSSSQQATATVNITQNSCVTITAKLPPPTTFHCATSDPQQNALTLTSTIDSHGATSSILGIGLNAHAQQHHPTATFVLSHNSHISIVATAAPSPSSLNKTTCMTTQPSAAALTTVSILSTVAGTGSSTVLGIAAYAFGYASYPAAVLFTVTRNSSLNFVAAISSEAPHHTAEVDDPEEETSIEIVSKARGSGASSILGVVTYSHGNSNPQTETNFTISYQSSVLVALSVLMNAVNLRSLCNYNGGSSAGGLVVASSTQKVRGLPRLLVHNDSQLSILVRMSGSTLSSGAWAKSRSAVATLGIIVFGADPAVVRVDTGSSVELWTGASNGAEIQLTSFPLVGAAVGFAVARYPKPTESSLMEVDNTTTSFSFCSDGTVTPTSPLTAPNGALIGMEPPLVPFNRSNTLVLGNNSDSSTACSRKAVYVSQLAAQLVEQAGLRCKLSNVAKQTPPVPQQTSSSATHSPAQSMPAAATPTPSASFTRHRFTATLTVRDPPTTAVPPSTPPPHTRQLPNPTQDTTPPTHTTAPHTLDGSTATPSPSPSQKSTDYPQKQNASTEPSDPPTQQPTQPVKRTVQVTTVMLPGDEEAVTIVVSSAGASNAIASTLGSSGAGVVVVAGSALRVMECGLSSSDPQPAFFELPIQFPLGDSNVRYYTGAVLAHTALQCLLLTCPIMLLRFSQRRKQLVHFLGMAFCGAHAFFTATVLGGVATILSLSDGSDTALDIAVAIACGLVMLSIHGVVSMAVHAAPRNGLVANAVPGLHRMKYGFHVMATSTNTTSSNTKPSEDEEASISGDLSEDSDTESSERSTTASSGRSLLVRRIVSSETTLHILITLFDGCRVFENGLHRHYSTVEVTIASIVAVIAGARPTEHCNAAAYAIGVLALAGLLYVVLVRPFRTRLDFIFSFINNLLLLILSSSVVVSLEKSEDDPPSSAAEKTMQGSLWLISVMAFVQLIAQGLWAYYGQQRRKYLRLNEDEKGLKMASGGRFEDQSLEIPMLVVDTNTNTKDRQGHLHDDTINTRFSRETDDDDQVVAGAVVPSKRRDLSHNNPLNSK